MTEIGMALSNTLNEDKVKKRLPRFVGQPLPNVQIRITRPENDKDVLLEAHGEFNKGLWSNEADKESGTVKITPGLSSDLEPIQGNLHVKGPGIFTEYWNRPDATRKQFTADGWFVTGDSISYDPAVNSFKILGRNSCDIIKSRGYKISALEMETKLLENQLIGDCAVIGVPDEVYGQKIIALVTHRIGTEPESPEKEPEIISSLDKWCQEKFASYSIPTIKIVNKVPRNQMGKVNKADLVSDFVAQANSAPVK